jgi:hypothetical protein
MKYNLNLVSKRYGFLNDIKFYERDRKKINFLAVKTDFKNKNIYLTVNSKKIRAFFSNKKQINFSLRSRYLFNLNDLKI